MSVINGVAKKYDGTAIDYVSIFNWSDGKCIVQVIPDSTGAWEYEYFANLSVGIAYVADGCEPITHGPYLLESVGHKWWRISNVTTRSTSYALALSRLVFTAEGLKSDQPQNGIAKSVHPDPSYSIASAFDNNSATNYHNNPSDVSSKGGWIGYVFDNPVEVFEVSVAMRTEYYGDDEWLSGQIDYSDDGINWFKKQDIDFNIPPRNRDLFTYPLLIV